MNKILIYGYGNPGRQDDGIGARFIELVEKWIEKEKLSGIFTDCNYQLNVEDSATIAEYDTVIFVDASVAEDVNDYKLESIHPDNARIEFSMHAVSTSYVVDLCQKIYGKVPDPYVLHIRAYEFDFVEELTPKAAENMEAAFSFLKKFVVGKIAKLN
jgi:hydrogenase maturation protease